MAKILRAYPGLKEKYEYHVFTNLDFWDARRILAGLATVQRNFGYDPPGDLFPTQVVVRTIHTPILQAIEKRLKKAVPSPPRHVVVETVLRQGYYEFDPLKYYPSRWSRTRMIHFSGFRLPIHFPPLATPHREMRLKWLGNRIRADRVLRSEKVDPVIASRKEAMRRRHSPSCF